MTAESPGLTLALGEYLTYKFRASFYQDVPVYKLGGTTGDVGMSVPVGQKGVELEGHVGGFTGGMETSMRREAVDSGTLYVTTQRVVFLGAKKTVDVSLGQVTAAVASSAATWSQNARRSLVVHTSASTDNLEFSLLGANMAAATIEWLKNPPQPPPQEEQPAPPKDADYQVLDAREFAKVVKDPSAAVGKLLTVYGLVKQFDTGTGPETLVCYINNEPLTDEDVKYPSRISQPEKPSCVATAIYWRTSLRVMCLRQE